MSGRLQDSPAHVVGKLIRDLTLGVAGGNNRNPWQVFVDSQPDATVAHDNVITVYNTSGRDLGFLNPTGEKAIAHGIMVRVRANRGSSAWNKVNEIAIAFDTQVHHNNVVLAADETHNTVRSYSIGSLDRVGDINSLGYEEGGKNRVFVFNAVAYLRQLS